MIGEIPATIATTDSGKLILPPERFKNAGEVRDVCQAMIRADRPRSAERAEVDKQSNGNPVYSLAKLRAKNQAWRARTNFRGLEGKLSELGNIFFDLNTEVSPPVRVFVEYGDNKDQAEEWSEIIAQHYGRMILQQWLAFDFHIPMRDAQMLRHGLGAHVWPIKNKWEPRTPARGNILFPEGTSVDFSNEGESFMLREFTPAHVLYGYVRNSAAAKQAGWDEKAVWETLRDSSKSNTQTQNAEEYEKQMRSADYGTSSRQAGVWLNYLFNIELDTRKISQYVIAETLEGNGKYLCKRRNYYDGFDDILTVFAYEIPYDGQLNSVRGFGARVREHYDQLNRVYNAMTDNVLISMYPQFKQNGSVDPEKLRLMRIGAMTIYPQGVEPQVLGLPNLAQGAIPLSQILNGSVNENNQTYLAGTPEPKDRETALSFQMRAQDSSRVSKATHSLYYRNVTRFHKKALLTAIKGSSSSEPWGVLAKEFRQRCLDDGVPVAALNNIKDIEAMRSVGAGSTAARFQALQLLMNSPVYLNAPEDKKIATERDFAASAVTYAQVDRYARNSKDIETPNADDTIIALENDALSRGGKAVVNSAQDHIKHGQGHLAGAGEVVQAVQNGEMDPSQGLQIIQTFGQHIAQHVKALEGNPLRKADYDRLMEELMALGRIADQLMQQVQAAEDAAQEQPPEEQVSDTLRIGMAKVSADNQVKTAKLQGDETRKNYKAQSDVQLKFGRAAADARLNAARAAAEQRLSLRDRAA